MVTLLFSSVVPFVVKLLAATVLLNLVVPALLVVLREPNGVEPPTAPSKVIPPVPLAVPLITVKSFAPLTVDLKAIVELSAVALA